MSEDQVVQTGPPSPLEAREPNLVMGVIAGLVAAAAGAAVWYGIVIATNTQFGLVAVGMGFLVGYAVKFGAGKNGSLVLQILGALLALVSIVGGEYLIIHHWIRQEFTDFTGWLGVGQFSQVYVDYLKEEPFTLVIYAIAVYEGFILPRASGVIAAATD